MTVIDFLQVRPPAPAPSLGRSSSVRTRGPDHVLSDVQHRLCVDKERPRQAFLPDPGIPVLLDPAAHGCGRPAQHRHVLLCDRLGHRHHAQRPLVRVFLQPDAVQGHVRCCFAPIPRSCASHPRTVPHGSWPLKFLRLTARLSTTGSKPLPARFSPRLTALPPRPRPPPGLFIPLTSTLISVFRCSNSSNNLGLTCLGTAHSIIMLIVGESQLACCSRSATLPC